jgi:transcriptional regulator with XRE-family HTH domain
MVYDNVCAAAKRLGLSINYIEAEAGLSVRSLCKWNKVSPTARSLKRVAKLLGVTVDSLQEDSQDT